MLIDFSVKLVALDGSELKTEKDTCITLGMVTAESLLSTPMMRGEPEQTDAKTKVECFELAKKVYAGGTVDLTAEQVVLAKARINTTYGPLIVGQAHIYLDGRAP